MSGTEADLYGLIGYPLGHTLSPILHQAALAWGGLPGRYVALPVPPERLAGALQGVRAWRMPGLNVTVPHKVAVIPFLDSLSPQALAIGAVNTLYWENDQLWGDNTDHAGFLASLPATLDLSRPITLLGAGGAARAVAVALKDRGATTLHVAARRLDQAQALREVLLKGVSGSVASLEADALAPMLAQSGLLINATSVGLDGQSCPVAGDALLAMPDDALVYDLIYNPAETPLLALARAQGLATQNGLEMLVGQAAAAFHRWTGKNPPLTLLRTAAQAALGPD